MKFLLITFLLFGIFQIFSVRAVDPVVTPTASGTTAGAAANAQASAGAGTTGTSGTATPTAAPSAAPTAFPTLFPFAPFPYFGFPSYGSFGFPQFPLFDFNAYNAHLQNWIKNNEVVAQQAAAANYPFNGFPAYNPAAFQPAFQQFPSFTSMNSFVPPMNPVIPPINKIIPPPTKNGQFTQTYSIPQVPGVNQYGVSSFTSSSFSDINGDRKGSHYSLTSVNDNGNVTTVVSGDPEPIRSDNVPNFNNNQFDQTSQNFNNNNLQYKRDLYTQDFNNFAPNKNQYYGQYENPNNMNNFMNNLFSRRLQV